jgi:hypothetical protein
MRIAHVSMNEMLGGSIENQDILELSTLFL